MASFPVENSNADNGNIKSSDVGCLSVIVFGASGDLAKKKTFPALFRLYAQGFLSPEQVQIFGYARSLITDEELRDRLSGYLKVRKEDQNNDPSTSVSTFLNMVTYISGPYDGKDGYNRLEQAIKNYEDIGICKKGKICRLFYLALPPSVYPVVSKMVKECCMNNRGWNRVVIEKPFGKDLASSDELSDQLSELFTEDQIYRIDHYLGKEIVQNLVQDTQLFISSGEKVPLMH